MDSPFSWLAFLVCIWFAARLIGVGVSWMKRQTVDVGFGRQLRGRGAVIAGVITMLVGVLAIAPFVWQISRSWIDGGRN
jgi:hypothetical protein